MREKNKNSREKYKIYVIYNNMLTVKNESGMSADKLLKKLKRKYDLTKVAKRVRGLQFYVKRTVRRKMEREKSLYRQHLRNRED